MNKVLPKCLTSTTPRYENGVIKMHFGLDLINDRGAGATWFHEHGHLIDEKAGNVSDDAQFLEILTSEFVDIVGRFNYNYSEIEEMLTDMRTQSAVSDIINGLSKDKIKGVAYHPLRMDGTSYWNYKSIAKESFAHMFECQFDRIRYDEMKKYFPKSLKYFESLLGGI